MTRPHQVRLAVRVARKEISLTPAEVAERAGVSRRFVSELEAGTRPRTEFAGVLAVLGALGREFRVVEAPTPGPAPSQASRPAVL